MFGKLKKIIPFIPGMLLCAMVLIFPCRRALATSYTQQNGYYILVQDDADLLSDAGEEALMEEMAPLTEFGNVAFLASYASNNGTGEAAENWYLNTFGRVKGVCFYIDMYNRMIYVYAGGELYNVLTTSYANTITDNVYKYATDEDYYTAAAEAFDQMYKVLNGKQIAQPMRYVSGALVAVLLALLVNYFIVSGSSGLKRAGARELLSTARQNVNSIEPEVVFTHETREYSPQSKGGSSGGGGGGGGGSFGGGGGHSF